MKRTDKYNFIYKRTISLRVYVNSDLFETRYKKGMQKDFSQMGDKPDAIRAFRVSRQLDRI